MTFEDGTTQGWTAGSVLVPIRVVEGTDHSGKAGLEITDLALAIGDDAGFGPHVDVSSRFPGSGDWYHVGLWLTSPNQPLTGVVTCGKHEPEYGAITVAVTGGAAASAGVQITQEWTHTDLWFKPTGSALTLSLSMRAGLIGSIVWLDDVTLERSTSGPTTGTSSASSPEPRTASSTRTPSRVEPAGRCSPSGTTSSTTTKTRTRD